ncbi:carbohydrate porin [Calothrix sp. PCC 6303]|uniref:carbohydrate porin n=1 Tax=Calothrix sp. PCC 6303 TaxID=1170562 RepID=UPI0002A00882|nr:carbohydrate porin [Calothrix sp. PCC 6303]AFZ01985.1 Carbohydrate-selective porin OprB [Calothrix sp. PCC 6303]
MKPQIFDCHKFISPSWFYRVYLLLLTTSSSVAWVVAVNQPSLAQSISVGESRNSGELLLVPKLPTAGAKTNLQAAPPPPGETPINPISAPISIGSGLTPAIQPPIVGISPANNIQQLENSLIQQARGKTPTAKRSSANSVLPKLAIGGDIPDLGLGLLKPVNTPKQENFVAQNTEQFNLQPPATTQEFTAPGAVTPTFNQFLNSPATATSQSAVVPLPPVLGEEPQPGLNAGNSVPTFNQLLNAKSGTQSSGNSRFAASPTFNQFLNSQTQNQENKPQNPEFVNESVANTQTPPTFSQLFNAQGGTLPTISDPQVAQQRPNTATPLSQQPNQSPPLIKSTALTQSSLRVQGVYLTQGEDSSARARLTAIYPLTPQVLFGATLDLVSNGSSFDDSRNEGLNINEAYFATSLTGLPNLRFAIGQLDLTSYFDRNSFAKDGASQFFNPVFQTNPALSVTGISSRPALLANWSVTDNIDAKAAVFSSSDRLSNFALDGFAGEIGIRYGNAIIRGTYATDRDAGNRDTFAEGFSIARGNNQFGPQKDDREEAYGLNAEFFIPNLKLGLFGRYGHYENRDSGQDAKTYVLGASFLDLFTPDDRLGLAYGRALSNDSLRRGEQPDVVELFYDFKFLPNLRLGFTVQGRDSFEETVLGVRVKSDFDVTPRGRSGR